MRIKPVSQSVLQAACSATGCFKGNGARLSNKIRMPPVSSCRKICEIKINGERKREYYNWLISRSSFHVIYRWDEIKTFYFFFFLNKRQKIYLHTSLSFIPFYYKPYYTIFYKFVFTFPYYTDHFSKSSYRLYKMVQREREYHNWLITKYLRFPFYFNYRWSEIKTFYFSFRTRDKYAYFSFPWIINHTIRHSIILTPSYCTAYTTIISQNPSQLISIFPQIDSTIEYRSRRTRARL